MNSQKLTALTNQASPATSDIVYVVRPGGTPTSYKATLSTILALSPAPDLSGYAVLAGGNTFTGTQRMNDLYLMSGSSLKLYGSGGGDFLCFASTAYAGWYSGANILTAGSIDTALSRSTSPAGGLLVASTQTAADLLTLQAPASHTGDFLDCKNSVGSSRVRIYESGGYPVVRTAEALSFIADANGFSFNSYVVANSGFRYYNGRYYLYQAGANFAHASDVALIWSSTTEGASGIYDVGLVRSSAGVLKVTDGSSGYGDLYARITNVNAYYTRVNPGAIYDYFGSRSVYWDGNKVGTDRPLLVDCWQADKVGLTVQLAASQAADGFQLKDAVGGILVDIDSVGNLNFAASKYIYLADGTDGWLLQNNAETFRLRRNGTDWLTLSAAGLITAAGSIVSSTAGGATATLTSNNSATLALVSPGNGASVTIDRGATSQTGAVSFKTAGTDYGSLRLDSSNILTLESSNNNGVTVAAHNAGVLIQGGSSGGVTVKVNGGTTAMSFHSVSGAAQIGANSPNTGGLVVYSGTVELLDTGYLFAGTRISSYGASYPVLVVKGAAGQTANLLELQNSVGTKLIKIEDNGSVVIGTLASATAAPLAIQTDGSGTGFVVMYSGTEYTRFLSGGVYKGIEGAGSLPLIVSNAGDIQLNPAGVVAVQDARNITVGTTTGTKIGTGTTQKLGFWNATPVAQPTAVADLTTTATSGTLPTPNGSVTVADASAPTVSELLEYCVELEAKLEAVLSRLRDIGLLAA